MFIFKILSNQFQRRQATVLSRWQRSCVGTDRLQVTGPERALSEPSVETPLVRADPLQELRSERVFLCQLMLGKSRPFLKWTSFFYGSDGILVLDAESVCLPQVVYPEVTRGPAGNSQRLCGICVCADEKLYLFMADTGATCHKNGHTCPKTTHIFHGAAAFTLRATWHPGMLRWRLEVEGHTVKRNSERKMYQWNIPMNDV